MCLAKPLRLLSIDADSHTGTVSAGGTVLTIGIDLVPDALPGEYVLVHAGMAIELIDDCDAREILDAYEAFVVTDERLTPRVEL
jgi:hydrogenase expression/formation protein HypC